MNMVDYHNHTKLCNHAVGEMEEYVQTAINKGIKEIGFSDHFPMNYQPAYSIPITNITMRENEIDTYLTMIKKAGAKFSDISIKTGFEVDFFKKENLFFNKYTNTIYPAIDYVIGSVHFIDDAGFDQIEFKEIIDKYTDEELWSKYLSLLKEFITEYSDFIDIIGHFDLPKKFGWYLPDSLLPELKTILDLVKEKNLTIEINTAGYESFAKEQYPSLQIIKLIYKRNIDITLGSDSHAPDNVGRYFPETINMLKNIGFNKLTKFTNHKKEYIEI